MVMGYSGKVIVISTGIIFAMYTLIGYMYFATVLYFLNINKEVKKYYRNHWWCILFLPFFNFVVFFIRMAGIINSINTDSAWRTRNLTDERIAFTEVIKSDIQKPIRVIRKMRNVVNISPKSEATATTDNSIIDENVSADSKVDDDNKQNNIEKIKGTNNNSYMSLAQCIAMSLLFVILSNAIFMLSWIKSNVNMQSSQIIEYMASMQFRNKDGSTRILNILDQTLNSEWSQEDINNYLGVNNNASVNIGSPIGVDVVGHGTDVAVIACGSDGVAPLSDIIIVKMAVPSPNSFPRTTKLMEALDYVINKAQMFQKPVAINISFGNNYGDHTGSGILEQFINDIAGSWKCSICIGTGNEGLGATHASGYVKENGENIVELAVGEYESSLNMQIWKAYWDDFDVQIIAPNGVNLGIINRYNVVNRVNILNTTLLTFYGEPKPFSTRQEIYQD